MPALFQFRNTQNGQEFLVDLCVVHILEARQAVQEMQALRYKEEEVQLLLEVPDDEDLA